jgi:hypothetical protein
MYPTTTLLSTPHLLLLAFLIGYFPMRFEQVSYLLLLIMLVLVEWLRLFALNLQPIDLQIAQGVDWEMLLC